MSSYLVCDKTIDDIVGIVILLLGAPGTTYKNEEVVPSDPTELGRRLLRLNHEALHARYGDEIPETISYTYIPRNSDMRVRSRSLSSWIYQCSEGDVPDNPTFRFMDAVDKRLEEMLAPGYRPTQTFALP